jgi:nucleoside-diphosphate-sugar epimerase
MRVFVTGASGFIGSAVVAELLEAGHDVVGLARSEKAAAYLAAAGARAHRGTLLDPDSLRGGAEAADGVIHTAFIHDFDNFAASGEVDRRAIEAMGETLAGSGRPLVVAFGSSVAPGRVSTEEDGPLRGFPRRSETAALPFAERGVRVSVVRLPPTVHGEGDHGFVARLIAIAREKGVSGYPGDGSNRWAAVHRLDAAHAFRLALEQAPAGARLHAVAEEGVPVREIAEVVARHLNLPMAHIPGDYVAAHFGWLGTFLSMDIPASSDLTRKTFGWEPTRQGLIADLEEGHYFTGTSEY